MTNLSLLTALTLKVSLLLLVAWAVCRFLRRSSAAMRQLVWTTALTGALLLPGISLTVPPVRPKISRPLAIAATVMPGIDVPNNPASASPRFPWKSAIASLYFAGVALILARMLVGSVRMAHIAQTSRPFPDFAESQVPVRLTNRLPLPVTWGVFRPVILLPVAAQEWPPERLRLVIAHEIAHVRRWDFPGQVAAQLACALYWFHPLAWWAFRQLIKEREQACDDEVLNMGVKGTIYADHLLNIIKSARQGSALFSPAVGMAQGSAFEHRLRAILNPDLNRRAPSWRSSVGGAILAAVLLLPLAAVRLPSQTASASIQGVVRDPSGAVIPRARILATNTQGSNVEAAYSGDDGSYRLSGIQPGQYTIEIKAPGFEPYRKAAIAVTAGSAITLDAAVNMGSINESVEVLGKRPSSEALTASRTPQRIRVGGMVQASKLLNKVQPVYPEAARQKGLEGTIILRAVIATDGRLLSLSSASASADPELTKAAVDAVQLWTYEPTLLNGEPVEVATTIAVTFRLQ